MQGSRRSSVVDCPVFRFSARADPRFVSPLAAGVAMSGGFGIVRTGATARSGGRRLDRAGAGWHPLARRPRRRTSVAVATATEHRTVLDESLSSFMRTIWLHVTGGQQGDIGRLLARMERARSFPVHRALPVRRAGRGASRGRPVRRRGLLRPSWWDARSDPRQGTLLGPGAGGWTRCRARPRGRGLRQGPRSRGHPDRGSRSHDRVG